MPDDSVVPVAPFVLERGDRETRASFRVQDSWCRTSTFELRSRMKLTVSELRFAQGFSFAAVQEAAEIELVISRGSTITSRTSTGDSFERGGGALQLASTLATTPVFVAADTDVAMDCVSLTAPAAVLCDLLGAREVPAALRRVTEGAGAFPLVT
jgi:hypothetical protein